MSRFISNRSTTQPHVSFFFWTLSSLTWSFFFITSSFISKTPNQVKVLSLNWGTNKHLFTPQEKYTLPAAAVCWTESVFSTGNWRSPSASESSVVTKYFRQSLSPRSCLSFHLHYSTRETRWHSFHPSVGTTPATWRIAADYRPDTFIWSVSAVILSSLTPAANNSALSPLAALAGGLWGRPGRQRWNVLRWNLKPFVCCCLHLECAREWAVERLSLGLWGADASPRFWGEKRARAHLHTFTLPSRHSCAPSSPGPNRT